MISEKLKLAIRDVPDFPKEGIMFKDITPILANPELSESLCEAFYTYWKDKNVSAVAGIESRGFLFGTKLAMMLGIPFIPIRKAGKLPYQTVNHAYELEYGKAEVEMHVDALKKGDRILIHDDLLATGGSAEAASYLIKKAGGEVSGYSFIIDLTFLNGKNKLVRFSTDIQSLVSY